MSPIRDPDAGCIIPERGEWPVDPQEDEEVVREDRLWVDGCFDGFHYGHAGVLLECQKVGKELYVGLHSDEDIEYDLKKGPPLMKLEERVAAIDASRFSTKCLTHTPIVNSLRWLDHYGCGYAAHGDDNAPDGQGDDGYRFIKIAGRMKIVPRTKGISTTDIISRILTGSKKHHIHDFSANLNATKLAEGKSSVGQSPVEMKQKISEYAASAERAPLIEVHIFRSERQDVSGMPSHYSAGRVVNSAPAPHRTNGLSSLEGHFESMVRGIPPQPDQRVVYVDGSFDLFTPADIGFLEAVNEIERSRGEDRGWYTDASKAERIGRAGFDYGPVYIVAGVHDDNSISNSTGSNFPISNIFERGLCVIQCRYVHAVVLCAPRSPNQAYLTSLPFRPATAANDTWRGPDAIYRPASSRLSPSSAIDGFDRAGPSILFEEVYKPRFENLDTSLIVKRVLGKRPEYEARQRKKGESLS